jgi:polyphenol oxidase
MREVALQPDSSGMWASIAVSAFRGMHAGVSLLAAGDMAIGRRHELPYRARLLKVAGLPERVFGLRQVHSRLIVPISDQDLETIARFEADGLIADSPATTLTVTVADCLPVFIVDTRSGAFGLIHSGWKGTGIVIDALSFMAARYASRASDFAVTIGPGIGACCYRVPEERAALFCGALRRRLRGARVGWRAAP